MKNEEKLNELKQKYEALNIQQIEEEIWGAKNHEFENRKMFIEGLFYLEKTNRFKENKRYKKADFWSYVQGEFGLSKSKYLKERFAFFQFPYETQRLGLGVVVETVKKCEAGKIRDIFREIKAEDGKGKLLPYANIRQIMKKYERPKIESTKIKDDLSKEDEGKLLIQEKQATISLREQLMEAHKEIERLNRAVEYYKKRYEQVLKVIEPVRAFEVQSFEVTKRTMVGGA